MKRRGFLGGMLLGMVGATAEVSGQDDYRPVGYMHWGSPGAWDVDFITLDGRRVERVTELDDVEGWVKYYGPNPEIVADPGHEYIRTYHETGVVRVHWKRNPGTQEAGNAVG